MNGFVFSIQESSWLYVFQKQSTALLHELSMTKVFISYRRSDSLGIVGRLDDHLKERFGANSVFRDTRSIEAGEDFPQTIGRALRESQVVLAIIGQDWIGRSQSLDSRETITRISQDDDYVRLEISIALRIGIPVIPVLVEQAKLPEKSALHPDTQDVLKKNALELSDSAFQYNAGKIVEAIRSIVNANPSKSVASRRLATISLVSGMIGGVVGFLSSAKTNTASSSIESDLASLYKADLVGIWDQYAFNPANENPPKSASSLAFHRRIDVRIQDNMLKIESVKESPTLNEDRLRVERWEHAGVVDGAWRLRAFFRDGAEGDFVLKLSESRDTLTGILRVIKLKELEADTHHRFTRVRDLESFSIG